MNILYKADKIRIPFEELDKTKPREAIIRYLKLDENKVKSFRLLRQSLDSRFSRSKGIYYEFSAVFSYDGKISSKHVKRHKESAPEPIAVVSSDKRPIIIGCGPSGLFAALRLIEHGIKPILIEQGKSPQERSQDVAEFFKTGTLNESSNVSFGFGGAGMFSDAKLTNRSKSDIGAYVLEKLVEFGSNRKIIYEAKPHLGTDGIRKAIESLKAHLEYSGATILTSSKATDIIISNSRVAGVVINNETELLSEYIVLACGNASRDMYEVLKKRGVQTAAKPFAIGLRVEHYQESVDEYIYAKFSESPLLPSAEYQFSYKGADGRNVYTFCNCPGGLVVNASSEQNSLSINGMSYSRRSLANANAAVVASVRTEDFGNDPWRGIELQREIEQKAFSYGTGAYSVPVMPLWEYIGLAPTSSPKPSALPGTFSTDLNGILPEFISSAIKAGLAEFCKKAAFYSQGVLSAPETRTSSPIRVLREASRESSNVGGLYPIGEGAGYAGGIMSSAIDGALTADAIAGALA
ncbi:MAG: NAD(P)/FAD-dependent oxidoreductase [Eubacteriaceae bacterium]|nr:NAD(P)/FAD-dependent oxidoreductase [Eubacteriaceae bacterium]